MKDRQKRPAGGPAKGKPSGKPSGKPGPKGADKRPAAAGGKAASPRAARPQASERLSPDRKRDAEQPRSAAPSAPPKRERTPAREPAAATEAAPRYVMVARSGEKPAERVPLILETVAGGDYHLIDSGDGEKLEQYGPYRIVRPEAQALWPRSLPASVWEKADAVFTGDTDEEGMGRWRFPGLPLGETWPMRLLDTDFLGRFTAFRHVGVFPEQLAHWRWLAGEAQKQGAR